MPSFIPNDPFYVQQSHFGVLGRLGHRLANTLGIERIWSQYTGQGVLVGVWDDGVQKTHWDLSANYDAARQVMVRGSVNDGQPVSASSPHGTSVAGLIAADQNGRGGVGVAFDSHMTGVTVFGGADDVVSHPARYRLTLDGLSQFDVTNHSYGADPSFEPSSTPDKFETAVERGRSGLGTINIKAAGNTKQDGSGEALSASRYTITVAAVSDVEGIEVTDYSRYGSHLLISAPEGSVTTDLLGADGYDGLSDTDYTDQFGGTSSATAVMSGVVSLILQANNALGWRDVYDVLAHSAIGAESLFGIASLNERFDWKWNGADNLNGGGLHYSEDYGFGVVNAFNAVRMAEVWSMIHGPAKTSLNESQVSTGPISVQLTIPDQSTLNKRFHVDENIALEHVSLAVELSQYHLTDLRISLTSPAGTTLSVYDGSSERRGVSSILDYTFGLTGFHGEQSAGTWTLTIEDKGSSANGTLETIDFTGFGAILSTNDVYHYTQEVIDVLAVSGQGDRVMLADLNGGSDWINAAAMYQNLVVDLNNGASSYVGGEKFIQLSNDGQTVIENIAAGDGDDQLTGNQADNIFYGGRGNDIFLGGAGLDTAKYLGEASRYSLTLSTEHTLITDRSLGGDGLDRAREIEYLAFKDQSIDLGLYDGVLSVSQDDLLMLTKLYIAYFNRAPDSEGLFYWGTRFSQGMDLSEIAASFFVQPESIQYYPNLDDTSGFVERVYQNLLGRDPDPYGWSYWVTELQAVRVSKPTFMLSMIYGAEAPTGSQSDAIYLTDKTRIGSYYAIIQGMNNVSNATRTMSFFDGTEDGIRSAKETSDTFFAAAQQPDSGETLMSLTGVINNPFAGWA